MRGALYAGLRFCGLSHYPFTEVAEHLAEQLPRVGGKFIQMEDEITPCALYASPARFQGHDRYQRPRFSLKQEAIGYAVMAESLPHVVVQRAARRPLTGLATKVAQGDVSRRGARRPFHHRAYGVEHSGRVESR